MITFIKAFLDKQIPYDGVDIELARTLRKVMITLTLPIIVRVLILHFYDAPGKSYIALSLLPMIFWTIYMIDIGRMYLGMTIIVLASNIAITLICIVGYGIHDNSVIAFPTTIMISCLILKKRELWIVSAFSIICISFVALGQYYSIYDPLSDYRGTGSDALLVGIVLFIAAQTSSSLSSKYKKAIKIEKDEIKKQEKQKDAIKRHIMETNELFKEVHHRVKNHLTFINSLIDMEAMPSDDTDRQIVKELQNRVFVVARTHDQLYKSDNYEKVRSKEYLEGLISSFLVRYNFSESQLHFQMDDAELDAEKIILISLSLHEIIGLIAKHGSSNPLLNIHFIFTKSKVNIMTIICNHEVSMPTDDDSIEVQILNHLVRKLNGTYELITGKNKSVFELTF